MRQRHFLKGWIDKMREIVLYYAPENAAHTALIKGVLVQMGIKIKNLTPGRCEKRIGFLAGMDGFEEEPAEGQQASFVDMKEELLVLCGFSDERVDQLLAQLKKAGVPRSVIKALVTETNAQWTVYELYRHLIEERKHF